ncbi:MAG TPA: response regulator [Gaiellaceae bacterium]|jgi:Response regulator containing a CheY-like receiver domain and an HTH DNA-binding domain|nr:response regulator [Gaiellaceae bacterium]
MARSPSLAGDEPIGVLICDDIEAMRNLLRIVVELDPRFRVAGEAGNGDEAVTQAQELQPDVILLDLSMPGRTGLDALPAIRVVAPAAAVIAFSGLDESVVAEAALAAGAALFLQKGARPDAILAAIEAVHQDGGGAGYIAPAQNGGYGTGQDVQSPAPGLPA